MISSAATCGPLRARTADAVVIFGWAALSFTSCAQTDTASVMVRQQQATETINVRRFMFAILSNMPLLRACVKARESHPPEWVDGSDPTYMRARIHPQNSWASLTRRYRVTV